MLESGLNGGSRRIQAVHALVVLLLGVTGAGADLRDELDSIAVIEDIVDGELDLTATDPMLRTGSLALYSWGSVGSKFRNVRWHPGAVGVPKAGGGQRPAGSGPSGRTQILR